jgi:hypothetical protein
MPAIKGFKAQGGQHVNATAIANVLAHAGQVNPVDGEPFDDVFIAGVGGGLGNGLGDCPSILRHGFGAGISVVGAYGSLDWAGAWQDTVFKRFQASVIREEASSAAAGAKKALAQLDEGRPVLLQCARMLPQHGDDLSAGACGASHAVVIHAIDTTAEVALVAEHAKKSLGVPLAVLDKARGAVCTHKRRQYAIKATEPLTVAAVAAMARDGMQDGVAAMKKPRITTYSLAALLTWADNVENFSGKKGWVKNYGARIAWPLMETWATIECAPPRGGLGRAHYAEFVERAAGLLRNKALDSAATAWRSAGKSWQAVAAEALPVEIKPFAAWRKLKLDGKKALLAGDAAKSRELANAEISAKKSLGTAPHMEGADLEEQLRAVAAAVRVVHAAETKAWQAMDAALA